MAVRANWHLEDLDLPDVDPAAGIAKIKAAPKVELSSDGDTVLYSEQLAAQFQSLVAREANFAAALYQECDLKWSVPVEGGGHRNPCRTCPLFCHDSSHADSLLCNLGVEQENVLDAFLAARESEQIDAGLLRAVEQRFDAAHELAEALL